jgi:hypothetical protein
VRARWENPEDARRYVSPCATCRAAPYQPRSDDSSLGLDVPAELPGTTFALFGSPYLTWLSHRHLLEREPFMIMVASIAVDEVVDEEEPLAELRVVPRLRGHLA